MILYCLFAAVVQLCSNNGNSQANLQADCLPKSCNVGQEESFLPVGNKSSVAEPEPPEDKFFWVLEPGQSQRRFYLPMTKINCC